MNLSRQGYPLGALFVLVTLAAVLVGGIAPLSAQWAATMKSKPGSVGISMADGRALCRDRSSASFWVCFNSGWAWA